MPFFGGADDVAALLVALAIVQSDPSAELVILSFLEPEKAKVTGGGADSNSSGSRGGSGKVGNGARIANGSEVRTGCNKSRRFHVRGISR